MKKFTFVSLTCFLFIFSNSAFSQLKTVVQFGHDLPVTELTYSPDGKILASTDGLTIKLWDLSTGMEFKTLYIDEGQLCLLTHLQFIKGEKRYVISYLYNRRLVYQDALTGNLLERGQFKEATDSINSGEMLNRKYSERFNNTLVLDQYLAELDKISNKEYKRWEDLKDEPSYTCFDHNKNGELKLTKRIGSFEKDEIKEKEKLAKAVIKYNKALKKEIEREKEGKRKGKNKKQVSLNQILPEVYVPKENEPKAIIELWWRKEDKPHYTLILDRSSSDVLDRPQWDLHISPGGTYAIERNHLYNLNAKNDKKDKKEVGKLRLDGFTDWTSTIFSHDGNFIISGASRTTGSSVNLVIWDSKNISREKTANKEIFDTVPALKVFHSIICPPVKKLILSPHPGFFITLHNDQTLKYWNINTGQEDTAFFEKFNLSRELNGIQNINAICIRDTGQTLITCGSTGTNPGSAIHVWDIATGSLARELGTQIPPVKFSALYLHSDSLIAKEWEPLSGTNLDFLARISQQKRQTIGLRNLLLNSGNAKNIGTSDSLLYSQNWQLGIKKSSGPGNARLYHLANKTVDYSELTGSNGCSEFAFDNQNKFIAGIKGKNIVLWRADSGKDTILQNRTNVGGIVFNITGDKLVSVLEDSSVTIWDMKNFQNTILGIPKRVKRVALVKEILNQLIVLYNEGILSKNIFQFLKDEAVKMVRDKIRPGKSQPDKDKSFARVMLGHLSNKNVLSPHFYTNCILSRDGKKLFLWRNNGYESYYYDFSKKEFDSENPEPFHPAKFLIKQEITKFFYSQISESDTSFQAKQLREGLRIIMEREQLENYSCIHLDGDSLYFGRLTNPHSKKSVFEIENLNTNKSFTVKDESGPFGKPFLSKSGKYLAASNRNSRFPMIRLWDISAENPGSPITFYGHAGEIIFSEDEKLLMSSGQDRQIKVWKIDTAKKNVFEPLFSFIAIKGTDDYIIYTPDGYYLCTRGNINSIAFQLGEKAYPFEQFDLKFNRPDIVTKELSKLSTNKDTGIIQLYHQAYIRRIDKMKLNVKNVEDPTRLIPPKATILNKEKLLVPEKDSIFSLKIRLEGTEELKQFNIYINGVPVYGSRGCKISGKNPPDTIINVHLSPGINKIQLIASDVNGLQSLYDTYTLKYDNPNLNKNIYIFNIAVFEDLPQIKNDLEAWNKIFEGSTINIKNLYNDTAAYDSILNLKKIFQQIRTDDEIIVFYSGHGSADNRLLTGNNSDPLLPVSVLESLFDSIPCRNKLLLINACFSGEKEYGKIFRSTRDLFLNLDRDNGSSVIVSCEGEEEAIANSQNTTFGRLLNSAFKEGNSITVHKLANVIERGCVENQHPYAKFINMDSNFVIK